MALCGQKGNGNYFFQIDIIVGIKVSDFHQEKLAIGQGEMSQTFDILFYILLIFLSFLFLLQCYFFVSFLLIFSFFFFCFCCKITGFPNPALIHQNFQFIYFSPLTTAFFATPSYSQVLFFLLPPSFAPAELPSPPRASLLYNYFTFLYGFSLGRGIAHVNVNNTNYLESVSARLMMNNADTALLLDAVVGDFFFCLFLLITCLEVL